MTATLALMHRTLAAADCEGLPEPVGTRILPLEDTPELTMQVQSAEDSKRWQEWLTRQGADGDWTCEESDAEEGRVHFARAGWRGWLIELVYLTPVLLEVGVAGD